MKLLVKKGATSKLVQVFIQDNSVTTGAGLTGLVFNTASLSAYYYREGAASATAITLATMTLGTWTSGGFVVVDGTNMPGVYQLSIPDAALATGANSVVIMLKGATNMAPVLLEIQLTDFDPGDMVTDIWAKAMSDISSVPAITGSVLQAINWQFALARNKRTQTATTETVYRDDGTTSLATSTKSDDGETFSRDEYV